MSSDSQISKEALDILNEVIEKSASELEAAESEVNRLKARLAELEENQSSALSKSASASLVETADVLVETGFVAPGSRDQFISTISEGGVPSALDLMQKMARLERKASLPPEGRGVASPTAKDDRTPQQVENDLWREGI